MLAYHRKNGWRMGAVTGIALACWSRWSIVDSLSPCREMCAIAYAENMRRPAWTADVVLLLHPCRGKAGMGQKWTIIYKFWVSIPTLTLVCFVLPDMNELMNNSVWSGTAARLALGTPSPWGSKERRAGFSLITRTVAWAN